MHTGTFSLFLAQSRYLFPRFGALRGRVAARVRSLGGDGSVAESLVTYPSPVWTGSPVNDQAAAFFYQPRAAGRHPVALILHGLGSRDAAMEKWLAREFARRGLAALVPVFPDHLMRQAPGGLWQAMRQGDPEGIRVATLQGLLDLRRALDWLDERAEIAPDQRGVVGISLGAVEGVMTLGVESRVKAGVLILGGADLARSLWASRFAWAPLRRLLERRGVTEDRLRRRWRSIEPLSFADRARLKPIYMINARFDAIVSRGSTERLREALGHPPIDWLPTGHTTASLFRRRILNRALSFLGEALGLSEGQLTFDRVPSAASVSQCRRSATYTAA